MYIRYDYEVSEWEPDMQIEVFGATEFMKLGSWELIDTVTISSQSVDESRNENGKFDIEILGREAIERYIGCEVETNGAYERDGYVKSCPL
jgi:hypothetical protein